MMWDGHQREELNIWLDGKEIKQVDGFVYITEDGHSAAEVRRRTQAGANAWRKVEGVTLDRKGRGSHVGQKNFDKAERESPENVCYTSMPVWSGDSGVDRTTTTEAARL